MNTSGHRIKRIFSAVLAAFVLSLCFSPLSAGSLAAAAGKPSGENVTTNLWGSGGQITFDLTNCSEYMTVTAVAEFDGTVSSASGWGFDSYTVSGSQVTAVVRADGPNAWALSSNVGIQVEGSDITEAKLVSVTGSGTAPDGGNDGNTGDTGDGGNTGNDGNSEDGGNGGSDGGNGAEKLSGFSSPAVSTYGKAGDDWLTTECSRIVDLNGEEVWLTGLNWFGYNTGTNLFDGLWSASLETSIKAIADHGFNLMRIPMSAELLLEWKAGKYPEANYNHAENASLSGLNSLEIFDYVLTLCEENGIKVMVDIHSANTDASGHNHPVWYTSKISEDKYVEALTWIADRYKNYDTIVAYDLKNEPHGKASETPHAIWNDSNDANNWKRAAERAGNAILDVNPHALIVIEGIQIYPTNPKTNNFTSSKDSDYYNTWWGANLMAVKDYPIDFGDPERNKQIVYSPHDYGPLVYEQPWFTGNFDGSSLYRDAWHDYWLYIAEEDIAPVLIGEWGGFMSGKNLTWMECLRDRISSDHLHHTFWCFNANSGDTGGLVKDDFKTWDEEKYALVKPVLWAESSGKFIGLDHAVPLGKNGISLSAHTGKAPEPPMADEAGENGNQMAQDEGQNPDQAVTNADALTTDPAVSDMVSEESTNATKDTATFSSSTSDNTVNSAADTDTQTKVGSAKTKVMTIAACVIGVAAFTVLFILLYRKSKRIRELEETLQVVEKKDTEDPKK
jgi:aryl-phospho-beta-D-glucosidase BglC (GH1 family)